MSEYKFINRDFDKTILLIPGWATDYRIFSVLDIPFNYFIPGSISPYEMHKELEAVIENHTGGKISVLGWSMGTFIAQKLALKYPDIIDGIIFVSAREKYPEGSIELIRNNIEKNRRATMYKFYTDCFSKSEKEEMSWFKKNLMKEYLDEMSSKSLIEGLEYLSRERLDMNGLKRFDVQFIHGEDDRIAPLDEVVKLKESLPEAKMRVVSNSGHMPFLSRGFNL